MSHRSLAFSRSSLFWSLGFRLEARCWCAPYGELPRTRASGGGRETSPNASLGEPKHNLYLPVGATRAQKHYSTPSDLQIQIENKDTDTKTNTDTNINMDSSNNPRSSRAKNIQNPYPGSMINDHAPKSVESGKSHLRFYSFPEMQSHLS